MEQIKLPDRYNKLINKATSKILRESAKLFARDYRNQYRSIIYDFYKDYPHPRRYSRTLETQNANILRENDYDYKKTLKFLNPTTIQFKFSVGTEYIQGTPYRADTDWVFNRTYFEGIHGATPDEVAGYRSMSYLINKYRGYNLLPQRRYLSKFDWALNWNPPKQMNPPPAALMDTWHKQYKMPTHLREILQPLSRKIMNEMLS